MRYISVFMNYGMSYSLGKPTYELKEIFAIRLDEALHKESDFHFVNERQGAYISALQAFDEEEVIVADELQGWEAFTAWIDKKNDRLVFWDNNISKIVVYYTKAPSKKKYRAKKKEVNLRDLYTSMTHRDETSCIYFEDAMKEQELTYDSNKGRDVRYNAEAQVRLFRKLYKIGRDVMEATFAHGLLDEDYYYISRYTFFPKLEAKMQNNINREILQLVYKRDLKAGIVGDTVQIETAHGSWRLELKPKAGLIKYFTKKYYLGERHAIVNFKSEMTFEDKINAMCSEIWKIEKQLEYGVGSEEITKILEKLYS